MKTLKTCDKMTKWQNDVMTKRLHNVPNLANRITLDYILPNLEAVRASLAIDLHMLVAVLNHDWSTMVGQHVQSPGRCLVSSQSSTWWMVGQWGVRGLEGHRPIHFQSDVKPQRLPLVEGRHIKIYNPPLPSLSFLPWFYSTPFFRFPKTTISKII